MMPIGHSYPFVAGSVNVEHLNKEVEKAIACLDIENGPANVDMIIPNVGKPYIIEIGARIGSNCLPELTSYHLGIDWVQYSVRSALGDSLRFPQLASNPCAAYILEAPKNGILSDVIIPGWIHSHQDVIELEITASIGDTVHTLTEGAHMVGKVIAAGSTVQSADLLAKRIRDGIVFKVE